MRTQNNLTKIVEKLSYLMEKYEDEALNSDELTPLTVKQINYIDLINKLNEPTFSILAEKLEVTKPTVTVAVNKLVRQNYVKKVQSNQDRRVYHLCLTKKGQKVVAIHNQAHRGFANKISDCLTTEESKILVEILQKVINSYS